MIIDSEAIDYILNASDEESSLAFKLEEIEAIRYPSARLSLRIHDFRYGLQLVDFWVEIEELEHISNSIENMLSSKNTSFIATSMSPRELQIRISKINSRGYFEIRYEINRYRYVESHMIEDGLKSGFVVQYQSIIELKDKVQKLIDHIGRSANNVD